jgi:hypothetical protein
MSCADSWHIRDPLVLLPGKERDAVQPEQVDDHHLTWQRSFPIPMWTYQVCFDLSPKGSSGGLVGVSRKYERGRSSQIILIDKASVLVIDGAVKLKFLRRNSFRLVWNLCEAWLNSPEYQKLGGVPPQDIERICLREDIIRDRSTLNTRWYEEIEVRRSRTGDAKEDEGMLSKIFDIVLLKGAVVPRGVSKERYALEKLRSVFRRIGVSEGADIHGSSRLFSVGAAPGDVHLCPTWTVAKASNLGPFGETAAPTSTVQGWDLVYRYRTETVSISREGDPTTTVSTELINLGSEILQAFSFSQTVRGHTHAREPKAEAWLSDGTRLKPKISLREDHGFSTVNLIIAIPDVAPGDSLPLSFSLDWQGSLYSGHHRHGVVLHNPYEFFHLQIKLKEPWRVLAPMTFVGDVEKDAFQPTLTSASSFEWKRFFPIPYQIYNTYYDIVK